MGFLALKKNNLQEFQEQQFDLLDEYTSESEYSDEEFSDDSDDADDLFLPTNRYAAVPTAIVFSTTIENITTGRLIERPNIFLDLTGLEIIHIAFGTHSEFAVPSKFYLNVTVAKRKITHSEADANIEAAQPSDNGDNQTLEFQLQYSALLREKLCAECHPRPGNFILHVFYRKDGFIKLQRVVFELNRGHPGFCDVCLHRYAQRNFNNA